VRKFKGNTPSRPQTNMAVAFLSRSHLYYVILLVIVNVNSETLILKLRTLQHSPGCPAFRPFERSGTNVFTAAERCTYV